MIYVDPDQVEAMNSGDKIVGCWRAGYYRTGSVRRSSSTAIPNNSSWQAFIGSTRRMNSLQKGSVEGRQSQRARNGHRCARQPKGGRRHGRGGCAPSISSLDPTPGRPTAVDMNRGLWEVSAYGLIS